MVVSFETWRSLERVLSGRERAYEEVLGVDIAVLGEVEVLLGHEYTLLEEVLVDFLAVGFGDKPGIISQLIPFGSV